MEGWIGPLEGYFDGYKFHSGPVWIEIKDQHINEVSYQQKERVEIDGRGKILCPPFVDGHTHLIFAGTRFNELAMKLEGASYNEILAKGGGIISTVKATRNASDEELLDLVLARLDVMQSHGTMTVEIKSGYGLNTVEELRLLNILQKANQRHNVEIYATFGGAHVISPDMSRENYVATIIDEMIPVVAKQKLASSVDVFCDKGAFNVEETFQIFDQAQNYHLPVRVHADELEYTGIAAIAARKYKLRSADHLLRTPTEDFQVLAEQKTVAMFMPTAPFGLFSTDIPTGHLQTPVTVGLGSDFNPNNWSVSMQEAMRMSVFRYRLTPERAMKAAISGSFQAITGETYQKLQEDSLASFLLIHAESPEALVSKLGQNLVHSVYYQGRRIVENKMPVG